MTARKITLDEFRLAELRLLPLATGELSNLLREIGLAAKRIHAEVGHGGLRDIFGTTDSTNVSGEPVKKVDLFANDELMDVLKNSVSCAGAASEEEEDVLIFDNANNNQSKYVVMFDPIDGSGNIENCMPVGTIFGIYRRLTTVGGPCSKADFLQCGTRLVAAGYVIYGSSTILVYATKRGVNGFTLDSSIGEFCLSHKNIICPDVLKNYSVNDSKLLQYAPGVQEYIKGMQRWNLHHPGSFSSRYVGSMAADLHRILLEGGVFLYPATHDNRNGKLRLMYECNPLAFIFQMAGGMASDGYRDILSIEPECIHQRTPLYIGSSQMMQQLIRTVSKNYSVSPGA